MIKEGTSSEPKSPTVYVTIYSNLFREKELRILITLLCKNFIRLVIFNFLYSHSVRTVLYLSHDNDSHWSPKRPDLVESLPLQLDSRLTILTLVVRLPVPRSIGQQITVPGFSSYSDNIHSSSLFP